MAYNKDLALRIRTALAANKIVEEKKMFRGICFMLNGKMCICVSGNELLCRIDPVLQETLLEKPGCRPMLRNGKAITGYVYVDHQYVRTEKDFHYWLHLCLSFNDKAKASKKKKAGAK